MSMSNRKSNPIRTGEQCCLEQGYVQCGANWYRCYGQGLLHVVTFRGPPERKSSRKQTTSLEIYSLYDWIMWVDLPIMGARRDVIPGISPSVLVCESVMSPEEDVAHNAEVMIDHGFSFLNKIDTHAKLADFCEYLDGKTPGGGRKNDNKKIIPYLLSGQSEKATAVIDAIEQQNRQAHETNCRMMLKSYDPEIQLNKMFARLRPYLSLRDSILARDASCAVEILQINYQKNVDYLSAMGICVPDNHLTNRELVQLMQL